MKGGRDAITLHQVPADYYQTFAIVGAVIVACCLLLKSGSKWWELRGELLKAKLKMRLAAENYKRKDVGALINTLMSSAMRHRYGAHRRYH